MVYEWCSAKEIFAAWGVPSVSASASECPAVLRCSYAPNKALSTSVGRLETANKEVWLNQQQRRSEALVEPNANAARTASGKLPSSQRCAARTCCATPAQTLGVHEGVVADTEYDQVGCGSPDRNLRLRKQLRWRTGAL